MRIPHLKSKQLCYDGASTIILDAFRKGIVGTTILKRLVKEWDEPSFEEFRPRTAWSLTNALTHVITLGFWILASPKNLIQMLDCSPIPLLEASNIWRQKFLMAMLTVEATCIHWEEPFTRSSRKNRLLLLIRKQK